MSLQLCGSSVFCGDSLGPGPTQSHPANLAHFAWLHVLHAASSVVALCIPFDSGKFCGLSLTEVNCHVVFHVPHVNDGSQASCQPQQRERAIDGKFPVNMI